MLDYVLKGGPLDLGAGEVRGGEDADQGLVEEPLLRGVGDERAHDALGHSDGIEGRIVDVDPAPSHIQGRIPQSAMPSGVSGSITQ